MTAKNLLALFLLLCIYSCQPELDPVTGTEPVASYSFVQNGGTCAIAPLGVYKKNVPLDGTNKVEITIDATLTGTWQASTNAVNGISFSGSGKLTSTGNQKIILLGSGNPAVAGVNSFTVTSAGNTCGFSIDVDTSTLPVPSNIPPIANAGADASVTLPASSITLTGSGTDSDGSLASYLWTRIAGPAGITITSPTMAQTAINGLTAGTYQFELKVTDNLGAIGKDTVSIVVMDAPATGSLFNQQFLFGTFTDVNSFMGYDAMGHINHIPSNHYPERVIAYANGKISEIQYRYDIGNGTYQTGQTHKFIYDANGNVSLIEETDNTTNQKYPFAEFTWYPDNTIKSKKEYWPGPGLTVLYYKSFTYTNGNLTRVTDLSSDGAPVDSVTIVYDTRVNNFPQVNNQFYYLDILNVFDQTYRAEMFYFSKNYPVSYGGLPISVTTNAGNKPEELRYENKLWYRYIYN